jgi:hypothetical protein
MSDSAEPVFYASEALRALADRVDRELKEARSTEGDDLIGCLYRDICSDDAALFGTDPKRQQQMADRIRGRFGRLNGIVAAMNKHASGTAIEIADLRRTLRERGSEATVARAVVLKYKAQTAAAEEMAHGLQEQLEASRAEARSLQDRLIEARSGSQSSSEQEPADELEALVDKALGAAQRWLKNL